MDLIQFNELTVIPVFNLFNEIPESVKYGNMNSYYVYIMASFKSKVLYIGVTNDLARRVYEHKSGLLKGFTKKYNCKKLVWYRETNDINAAIQEEKRMKKWKREFKVNIIEELNSTWKDLFEEIQTPVLSNTQTGVTNNEK